MPNKGLRICPNAQEKKKELLQEAISDIIQEESNRVKQLLAKKTGIMDNEYILKTAIQAAKESIEDEYG